MNIWRLGGKKQLSFPPLSCRNCTSTRTGNGIESIVTWSSSAGASHLSGPFHWLWRQFWESGQGCILGTCRFLLQAGGKPSHIHAAKEGNACIIPLSRLDLKSLLTDFYPLNSSLCKVLMLSFGDYLFQEIAHSLHPQSSKMLKYRWKFQTPIQLDSSWLSLMMWPLTLTEFWQRLPPVLSGGCSLITNKECRPEWALA